MLEKDRPRLTRRYDATTRRVRITFSVEDPGKGFSEELFFKPADFRELLRIKVGARASKQSSDQLTYPLFSSSAISTISSVLR